MKNPLFQLIASGVALGLMCGAVSIHALHVSGAKELGEKHEWSPMDRSDSDLGSVIVPTGGVGFRKFAGSRNQRISSNKELVTLQALEEIVAHLQELKSENQGLHGQNLNLLEQLAETNRDLSELQFRVDTHSQSFRPMRVSSESLQQGLLSPGGAMHPLLPPKGP
jgi:hypothetical protein